LRNVKRAVHCKKSAKFTKIIIYVFLTKNLLNSLFFKPKIREFTKVTYLYQNSLKYGVFSDLPEGKITDFL